jgi:hypothetical protein
LCSITATTPKQYHDNSSLPLWAVETLPAEFDFSDAQPLWGILGTSNSTPANYMSIDNISTVLQESLYLPGDMDQYYFYYDTSLGNAPFEEQNLPKVDFYSQALATAVNIGSPTTNYQGVNADYSGMTSLALFAKLRNLSESADTASTILNLVWTDAAANLVVGTKGWGLSSGSNQQFLVPIMVYRKVILYRSPFATPAFIVLTAFVAVLTTLLLLTLTRKTGLGRMRALLEVTSAGRIIGMSLWPGKQTGRGTKEWIEKIGTRGVKVTKDGIFAEENSLVEDVEEVEEEASIDNGSGGEARITETKPTAMSDAWETDGTDAILDEVVARQNGTIVKVSQNIPTPEEGL